MWAYIAIGINTIQYLVNAPKLDKMTPKLYSTSMNAPVLDNDPQAVQYFDECPQVIQYLINDPQTIL